MQDFPRSITLLVTVFSAGLGGLGHIDVVGVTFRVRFAEDFPFPTALASNVEHLSSNCRVRALC